MTTCLAGRSTSIPCRASWYSRCPFTDTAEYMGGTCQISPHKPGQGLLQGLPAHQALFFSLRFFPVTSPVSRRSPSRNRAAYSLSVSGSRSAALAGSPQQQGEHPGGHGVPGCRCARLSRSFVSPRSTAHRVKRGEPLGLVQNNNAVHPGLLSAGITSCPAPAPLTHQTPPPDPAPPGHRPRPFETFFCGRPETERALTGGRGSWCPVGTAQDRPRRQPRPEPPYKIYILKKELPLPPRQHSLPLSKKYRRGRGAGGGHPFRRLRAAPSRLPARVLRPSGARPGPTVAEAETGAERCPLGTCAPVGGGKSRLPPLGAATCRWHVAPAADRAGRRDAGTTLSCLRGYPSKAPITKKANFPHSFSLPVGVPKGASVSAAASGPAPRWGASRTDRSGQRRPAMGGRHWRPSPPFEMRCIE